MQRSVIFCLFICSSFFFAAAAVVYIVFGREEVARRVGSLQEEACLQTCGRQSQHPHPASPLLIHLHLFLSDAAQRRTAKCQSEFRR